ncbi:MAG: cell envelope biogenesis protein TolA [Rhodoblastus sp.]
MLVAFSQDRKFDDAQEAIPVETITDSQFSQIMKGEKTAKEATGKPRVDRVADVSEPKPTPPTPEAKHDVPTPPPPLKRLPDPGEAEDQPTPTPPPLPAPTPPAPPQRPAPPKPAAKAPPQEDKAEREKDDAEPVKPPVRPKPPEKAEQKPKPPTPRPEPKPAPKPPKLDEVAKLLAESKDKAPAKPKSGEESNDRRTPDLAEISRMLSREPPKALGSVGRELNKTASLGAPNASAAKMSPSLSDALNGLLMEQYKACWSYLPLSNGPKYVPWIRVSYRPDGSLAGEPVLTNPPSDPVSRALADSAMRAVRRCNPLKIPARFQPFYDQWKDWKVGFDPVILN